MAALTGRIVTPRDPGWDEARKNYNQRFDIRPQAIVFCQNAMDVVNAVIWARETTVPFRARSGRHSYEGYSLVEAGLVIDVSEIDHVNVDPARQLATVGAGIDMLRLTEFLAQTGFTLPLATGPAVGLAGLALGGGFGMTSRKWGLTCDNVVEIELVDAHGQRIRASGEERPDLFWALRGGGGGNFGIATSLTLRLHPAGPAAMFSVEWPWEQCAEVVGQWQEWAPDAEDGLASALRLTVARSVRLYGQFTPDGPEDFARLPLLLAPMIGTGTPTQVMIQALPAIVAARVFFGEDVDPRSPRWPVHIHTKQQLFKSTAAAAMASLPAEAIALLPAFLERFPALAVAPPDPSMVQLLGGGGEAGRNAPDATAVFFRQARFIIQYNGFWAAPQDAAAVMTWVSEFRRAMLPYTRGAYVNYADSTLADYLHEYYGANAERLVRIKQRYDPDNVFNFPQSIPSAV
jgi:FAD/FMN-containing dehydrogenase